jgi:hypothetical protein
MTGDDAHEIGVVLTASERSAPDRVLTIGNAAAQWRKRNNDVFAR